MLYQLLSMMIKSGNRATDFTAAFAYLLVCLYRVFCPCIQGGMRGVPRQLHIHALAMTRPVSFSNGAYITCHQTMPTMPTPNCSREKLFCLQEFALGQCSSTLFALWTQQASKQTNDPLLIPWPNSTQSAYLSPTCHPLHYRISSNLLCLHHNPVHNNSLSRSWLRSCGARQLEEAVLD